MAGAVLAIEQNVLFEEVPEGALSLALPMRRPQHR